MSDMSDMADRTRTRREFLRGGAKATVLVAVGGVASSLLVRASSGSTVWQVDPSLCVQCERCSTHCVLSPSAVKCVHGFQLCGYCKLCGGYHRPGAKVQDTAAENQLCPTGAIRRRFIEVPFFEYTIDEALCIGCGRCAKGCAAFGNGSLYLQVRHDRCLNCNECSISRHCPSGAMRRVPADQPYSLKGRPAGTAGEAG